MKAMAIIGLIIYGFGLMGIAMSVNAPYGSTADMANGYGVLGIFFGIPLCIVALVNASKLKQLTKGKNE